jgi:hypothetical protein
MSCITSHISLSRVHVRPRARIGLSTKAAAIRDMPVFPSVSRRVARQPVSHTLIYDSPSTSAVSCSSRQVLHPHLTDDERQSLRSRQMDFDRMPWDGMGVISDLKDRAGTPLLLGPEGIATSDTPSSPEPEMTDTTAPADDSEATTATTTSERARPSTTASTSSSETTSTSSEPTSLSQNTEASTSSTSSLSASSPSLSSAIPSIPQDKAVEDGSSPVQLSSLAYLVPIFLLIALTIGTIIYRRYRARKKMDRESSTTFQSPTPAPRGVGWREIKDTDEKDDIWNDDSDTEDDMEEQWRKVQFKESKSRPGLLDVSTTAGWLRSAAWKSARSINVEGDDQHGARREGQRTVKLVTRSVPTYESLLPGEQPGSRGGAPLSPSSPGRFGSFRAVRDSLSSFSLAPIARRLERNKSPDKRYNRPQPPPPPPPEEPAWIRPRAASPINVLSPPCQPHFFFQPTPAQSMVLHRPELSESEYTVTDTESLLSNMPTDKRDTADSRPVFTRGQANLGADLDSTPTKASVSSSRPRKDDSPGKTPTMRRSSAVRNLAKSPSGRNKSTRTQKPTSPESMRKSRKQIKDEKARQRVETILQASWSDRALSSPSVSLNSLASPPDANGKFPGWASSGVEQVGGIQARLAMLKSIETGK